MSVERAGEGERLTRQADRTDVANVDYFAVTEAGRSQVDLVLRRLSEMLARRRTGKEGHLSRHAVSEASRTLYTADSR